MKTKSKHAVDVVASRSYHQSIFSSVDVIEVDVLVIDVVELDVLGARPDRHIKKKTQYSLKNKRRKDR